MALLLLAPSLAWGATAGVAGVLDTLQGLEQALKRSQATLIANENEYSRLGQAQKKTQAALQTAKVEQARLERLHLARVRRLLRASRRPGAWRQRSETLQRHRDGRLLRCVAAADLARATQLRAHTAALATLSTRLQEQRSALHAVMHKRAVQHQDLRQRQQKKARYVALLRHEKKHRAAAAREGRAAQQNLRAMLHKPATKVRESAPAPFVGASQAFAAQRGRLPWPARGRVKVAFGGRVELAFGTVTSHNGWDLATPVGTQVQSVAAGKVVYAGYLSGYGQLVIVDHGGGYHAVVAHLDSIAVQVGDAVAAGTTLGTSGDSGSLRGPVLYFEIRHHGTPQNPRLWLARG